MLGCKLFIYFSSNSYFLYRYKSGEPVPDIIFMCINKDILLDLCDLFPQTATNITIRSEKILEAY